MAGRDLTPQLVAYRRPDGGMARVAHVGHRERFLTSDLAATVLLDLLAFRRCYCIAERCMLRRLAEALQLNEIAIRVA